MAGNKPKNAPASSATVSALFAPSVPLEVEFRGVMIKLDVRPQGLSGKLVAEINEIQGITDEVQYAHALDNVAKVVDGLIVRWDLKESGSDSMPLVFAPSTKQRAQIVGLYPEYKPANEGEAAIYPSDSDRVEIDDVDQEKWLSYERKGPGLLFILDDPSDHTAVRGIRKGTYLPVSDVAALKMVPLHKDVDGVRTLPLEFMNLLMLKIMEAGNPKAAS